MLTARTLIEAQVYLSLVAAADPNVPSVPPEEPQPGVNTTEGPDAWVYSTPAGDISISYASEKTATTLGLHFGLGRSRLIDAAQWAMVARSYAQKALDADMAYTGAAEQDRSVIELNWEFAAEAIGEAIKFLPDDADEVPDSEIWSAYGARAKISHPNLVHRAKLQDDLEYFRGVLADFRALYRDS